MKSRYPMSTLLCLVTVWGSACAQEQARATLERLGEGVVAAAASIEPDDYLRKLGVIAHDSMGGRDTPSPGLEMTAAWIASEFERVGLIPGGDDGSYVQRYPIETVRPDLVSSSADGNTLSPGGPGSRPPSRLRTSSASWRAATLSSRKSTSSSVPTWIISESAHPTPKATAINNGADDDASGTTAVLEIAEAYASLPTKPKRSTIFLLVSGEEKGLLGSAYFTENPPVPTDRMVADLNADMVGRNWPDTIVAIGMEHSDLGDTLELVNEAHPELGMTAIDDIWPEERFYFRSDHYKFAEKGVPVLFFFNGTHEDYHGRDDEVDRIDADKATRSQPVDLLPWIRARQPRRAPPMESRKSAPDRIGPVAAQTGPFREHTCSTLVWNKMPPALEGEGHRVETRGSSSSTVPRGTRLGRKGRLGPSPPSTNHAFSGRPMSQTWRSSEWARRCAVKSSVSPSKSTT